MAGVFSLDLGMAQGRIASTNAGNGSYVYELGHANGIAEHVNVGDYHEIKQDMVLDPEAKFIRLQIRIVPPTSFTSGYGWKLIGKLNGVTRATRVISSSDPITRTLIDFAIPLALANTPPTTNEIAFRLEVTA